MRYKIKFYHPIKKKWVFWNPSFKIKKDLLNYWNMQPSSKKLKYKIVKEKEINLK